MKSATELKKQLEELCIYNVENDIIDFPFSKSEYSPYVVVSLLNQVPKDAIVQDVLSQLGRQIQQEKIEAEIINPEKKKTTSFIERIRAWIKSKVS